MKTTIMTALSLATLSGLFGSTLAGDLEPPGPPAPTMVTLQQIYDKMCAPIDIAKTGQTQCWDASATVTACAGTGQDGQYKAGVVISPRFTNNGNGTVRDNLTGLIWLKNADCFGLVNWATAIVDASSLASGSCGLTDGSVAGDWRLPNANELASLTDFGQALPALPPGHPFAGIHIDNSWTSTSYQPDAHLVWTVYMNNGDLDLGFKTDPAHVWPVRSKP